MENQAYPLSLIPYPLSLIPYRGVSWMIEGVNNFPLSFFHKKPSAQLTHSLFLPFIPKNQSQVGNFRDQHLIFSKKFSLVQQSTRSSLNLRGQQKERKPKCIKKFFGHRSF